MATQPPRRPPAPGGMTRAQVEALGIEWVDGKTPNDVADNVAAYGEVLLSQFGEMFLELGIDMAAWMKANRPWNDISGNARRGLRTAISLDRGLYSLYLIHSVKYGLYLELRHAGRYAVLLPALRVAATEIGRRLANIGSGQRSLSPGQGGI